MIPRFIVGMMKGRELTIHGDGTQSRDFTYVSNGVAANLRAVEAKAEGLSGEVFNMACGESLNLNDMVAEVSRALNVQANVVYIGRLGQGMCLIHWPTLAWHGQG